MAVGQKERVARINAVQAVTIALISGVFGLAGACVQLQITKPATLNAVEDEVNKKVPGAVEFVFDRGIPVGTVIASFLDPKSFAAIAGDDGSFDPEESKWFPADGRDAPGSEWAKRHSTKLPDLRGVFLRGLNYSEPDRILAAGSPQSDPENGRGPGSFQPDSLGPHFHSIVGYDDADTGPGSFVATLHDGGGRVDSKTDIAGSQETRPKNVAIYYYVKIN